MSDITRAIYRVNPIIQAYAKTPSSRFTDLTRRYKAITKSKRFHTAFPNYGTVPLVESTGGGSYAYTQGGHSQGRVITLGGNRCESVLLHEIAHHVAYRHPATYGREDGHGVGFALALLHVVRICQGAEAEKALRHMYRALNIRVHKPGTKRGGFARVQGDAPEKAAVIIANVTDSKERFARERATARTMVRGRGERVERSPSGGYYTSRTFQSTCPLCGGVGLVSESRRGRTQSRWYAECEPCQLDEEVTMSREVA
jgi:hypothetical protein